MPVTLIKQKNWHCYSIMKETQLLIKFILRNTAEFDVQHPLLSCEKLLISTAGFTDETKTTAWFELHHREERQ